MPQATRKTISRKYWPIDALPGLSLQDSQKLHDYGVKTTKHLLLMTLQPASSQKLITALNISSRTLAKWRALADLAQIPAVGCQYCGLILHSGILSSQQLAQTPINQLQRQVLRFYVTNLQRRDLCPTTGLMANWIAQSQILQPMAKH